MGAISLSDYQEYTEKTYEEGAAETKRVELIISAVNDWIEAYTGRVFGAEKVFTKRLDYDPVVFLPHIDITEVTEVKIDDVLKEDYSWEESGRIVLSLTGKSYTGNRSDYGKVVVKYKSQYNGGAVPASVVLAGCQIVSDNVEKDGSQDILQASTGGYSVSMGGTAGSSAGSSQSGSGLSVNGSVGMVLNNYRIRRV